MLDRGSDSFFSVNWMMLVTGGFLGCKMKCCTWSWHVETQPRWNTCPTVEGLPTPGGLCGTYGGFVPIRCVACRVGDSDVQLPTNG